MDFVGEFQLDVEECVGGGSFAWSWWSVDEDGGGSVVAEMVDELSEAPAAGDRSHPETLSLALDGLVQGRMPEVVDEYHRRSDAVGECSTEHVPVAEVDDREEDGSLTVPLVELAPLIGVAGVVAADGLVAVGGCEFVESDGVDEVLAVALELRACERGGIAVPVDVGQEEFCVVLGGVAAARPAVVDGGHQSASDVVGDGSRERAGGVSEGLVAEGEWVHWGTLTPAFAGTLTLAPSPRERGPEEDGGSPCTPCKGEEMDQSPILELQCGSANSGALRRGYPPLLLTVGEGFDGVSGDVVGPLLGWRLHEVGGRSEERAGEASVEAELGAAHGVDHDSGRVG